jgi:hypothetical protein
MTAISATIAAFLAWLLFRDHRRRRLPGRTWIVSPRRSTQVAPDGAVRSVQSGRLELPRTELDRLWTPAQLENLGRTYWLFLTRVTLGVIRVVYTEDERAVVLLARPLTLLRFESPQYTLKPDQGRISWAIRDGLLVSRAGRGSGFLSVTARRDPAGTRDPADTRDPTGTRDLATLGIDVEVANFYPAIASRLGKAVYEATQAFVHVLVTHAFLRSLATLELDESPVRRFPYRR